MSELQNDCSKRFKISPDEALRVVQELYEKKLVTYPRTDARVLSTAVAKEISRSAMTITNISTMDEINSSTWDLIHQGMEQMVASSTTFTGLDFSMAGKTGTAQHNELHADHVLFVGYAPAEQPQLSIAVRITYGYNSGYASEIGRDIAKVYFNPETAGELITGSAANLGEGIAGD